MRVLLVMPPLFRFGGVVWPHFHLGLGYLAAVLRQDGHDAWIYDANNATADEPTFPEEELYERYRSALGNVNGHAVWQEFSRLLADFKPEVVGISVRSIDAPSGLICADLVKRWNPAARVVMGGVAATVTPHLILTDSVDLAVRGEGEMTLREVLRHLAAGTDPRQCDGVSWKRDGQVVRNPDRRLIADLDTLPLPARDALLFADRLSRPRYRRMMGDLITSRGCPHQCTFCANHAIWGCHRVRVRSADAVVGEMELLRDRFGVSDCVIWDDHFTENRRRVLDICGKMKERRLGLKWLTFARATTIEVEMLRALHDAGCHQLQIGVESGSERILRETRKGITLADVRRAARLLREEGMDWLAFLMIGFPGETREEMMATMDLMEELQPGYAVLSVVVPYPGTVLYEQSHLDPASDAAMSRLSDYFNPESSLVTAMPAAEFKEVALACMRRCKDYNQRQALAKQSRFNRLWSRARHRLSWLKRAVG